MKPFRTLLLMTTGLAVLALTPGASASAAIVTEPVLLGRIAAQATDEPAALRPAAPPMSGADGRVLALSCDEQGNGSRVRLGTRPVQRDPVVLCNPDAAVELATDTMLSLQVGHLERTAPGAPAQLLAVFDPFESALAGMAGVGAVAVGDDLRGDDEEHTRDGYEAMWFDARGVAGARTDLALSGGSASPVAGIERGGAAAACVAGQVEDGEDVISCSMRRRFGAWRTVKDVLRNRKDSEGDPLIIERLVGLHPRPKGGFLLIVAAFDELLAVHVDVRGTTTAVTPVGPISDSGRVAASATLADASVAVAWGASRDDDDDQDGQPVLRRLRIATIAPSGRIVDAQAVPTAGRMLLLREGDRPLGLATTESGALTLAWTAPGDRIRRSRRAAGSSTFAPSEEVLPAAPGLQRLGGVATDATGRSWTTMLVEEQTDAEMVRGSAFAVPRDALRVMVAPADGRARDPREGPGTMLGRLRVVSAGTVGVRLRCRTPRAAPCVGRFSARTGRVLIRRAVRITRAGLDLRIEHRPLARALRMGRPVRTLLEVTDTRGRRTVARRMARTRHCTPGSSPLEIGA